MAGKKLKFLGSLLEFASGALPDSFSAQVLSQVPNERDDEEQDPDSLLRKKLETMLGTVEEPNDQMSDEDNDQRLFSILKGFLGHNEEGPHDDHPAEVDHDELRDIGPYPTNDDPTDAPHDGEVADEKHSDEKHNQLLSAINDLRQELQDMKSGQSQPQSKWKITRDDGGEEENEESYEEDEQEDTKQARARQMFTALVNQGMPRQDIIDQFMKNIGVTNSTATSYYQRLAKEAGLTTSGDREAPAGGAPPGLGSAAGMDPSVMANGGGAGGEQGMEMMPQEPESNIDGFEVEGDPDKQGLIRTVKGAHLVYKRKNEEGTYDELWVFSTGDDIKNTLEVRRAILAGTDIPPRALKSENGQQSYTLTSLGNGQILHIKGLPN
jgi:hypothetical protein